MSARAPWHLASNPKFGGLRVVDADDNVLAVINSHNKLSAEAIAEAAQAMVAAPELLEALDAIEGKAWLSRDDEERLSDAAAVDVRITVRDLRAARAVIEKARGK